ncbi:MAG: fluoride efflux transporter CrcB [Deltaproteobacteria bacterium]|nr:fluoride efflux transporter CrcB [Deltaproteobacteria bacterium]
MYKLLMVGLGGFVGSTLRYISNQVLYHNFTKPWLPYGTLFVNIVGCFLIGWLHGFFEARQIINLELRAFIFIGVLGGFTTFSTFGYETFGLAKNGQIFASFSNLFLHLLLGLLAVWIGDILSKSF